MVRNMKLVVLAPSVTTSWALTSSSKTLAAWSLCIATSKTADRMSAEIASFCRAEDSPQTHQILQGSCCPVAEASFGAAEKSLHRLTASPEMAESCRCETYDGWASSFTGGPGSNTLIQLPRRCCGASCGCRCPRLQFPEALCPA